MKMHITQRCHRIIHTAAAIAAVFNVNTQKSVTMCPAMTAGTTYAGIGPQ